MSNKKNQKGFEELEEQTNSDQAKQIERQWKKKVQEEKDKCYTKLMIIAIAVMAIIFIFMISFLSQSKKQHLQIAQTTYMGIDYIYLQSNFPHLKFLIPKQQATYEIRLLKALGIIYPELISWIENNVQQNMKILFIPNEKSSVNVLGISLGYYLKAKVGGKLDIGISKIRYKEMTTKNIQLMNSERSQGQKMPINLINLNQEILEHSSYQLIIIENNLYYKNLSKIDNVKLIIIKSQTQASLTEKDNFEAHNKYEIIKGRTNDEVRKFDIKYGYGIIDYKIEDFQDVHIILLVPKSFKNVELCPQRQIQFMNENSAYRNLMVYLQNKTFTQTTIYYGLQHTLPLQIIAKNPTRSKIYTNIPSIIENVIQVQNNLFDDIQDNKEIVLSKINYYILKYSQVNSQIKQNNIFIIFAQSQQQLDKIKKHYKSHKISVISPYNNKGCFYPPSISPYRVLTPFVGLFVIVGPI